MRIRAHPETRTTQLFGLSATRDQARHSSYRTVFTTQARSSWRPDQNACKLDAQLGQGRFPKPSILRLSTGAKLYLRC